MLVSGGRRLLLLHHHHHRPVPPVVAVAARSAPHSPRCHGRTLKGLFAARYHRFPATVVDMTHSVGSREKTVFKLVLTGGPCGGKTTGQARLCTFFENLGWKVYRVPETASVLLSGGVKFSDLNDKEAFRFQEDLIKSMIQIENTFFSLAESSGKNCLVICDRGTMDASAFVSPEQWERMLQENGWNPIELRDNRYNMIIHMVTAANGAEEFYTTSDHACRSETLDEARFRDTKAAQAWIGHPYFDVIDNSTDFDGKLRRMITMVCQKLGLDTGDRLSKNSRKVKFLIGKLPPDAEFPTFQDFKVVHDYLVSPSSKTQSRLRKRGQNNHWSYTSTIRRLEFNKQTIEVKTQITSREYQNMLTQRDINHYTIYKLRRCFLWNNQYFQLDIYMEPCHPRCKDLVLLETYTTLPGEDIILRLPSFLEIVRDVTGDPTYSMYTLSRKDGASQSLSAIELKNPGRSFATQTSSSIVNGHSNAPPNPYNGVDH